MGTALLLIAGAIAMALAAAPPALRDLDGRLRRPFAPEGRAAVLLFVLSDCPISNAYAPEIQSLCGAYAARGVSCLLLYEDARIDRAAAQAHRRDFRYHGIAAAIDGDRAVARAAGATITPEAALVDAAGVVRYRGRIDNRYADLGRRRMSATVHDLRDAIDAVLGGRPVTRAHADAVGCYIPSPSGRLEESR